MNSSENTIVKTCLYPNKIYRFGPPESYYSINCPIAFVNVVLLVFIILGNAVVTWAYFCNKALQTVPNMLLMSLALTDLFVGLVAQPLFVAILIRNLLGAEPLCWLALLSNVTHSLCSGASLMTLSLVISLERYLGICHPLKHRRWITKTKLKRFIFLVWSFLFALNCSLIQSTTFRARFLLATFFLFIGVAVTAFACGAILKELKARRRSRFSAENTVDCFRNHSSASSSASSNAIEKRDYKIVVTMFYIIGAVAACYTPTWAAILYAQIKSKDLMYLKYFHPVATTLMFLNSLLNPIIYCLRNRRFTSGIRRIREVGRSIAP